MMMKIPWEAVTASTAVLFLLGAIFAYYVRRVVREEFDLFKDSLDKTYMRSSECAAYRAAEVSSISEQSRRIDRLEDVAAG